MSRYIGELSEGFRGNASPENLETLFQLITLYATAPRLGPVAKPTLPVQPRPLTHQVVRVIPTDQ